jgi:chromosome segregation ATPase
MRPVPDPARQLWRRAKLQVADDVRTRLDTDLSELRERLSAIERRLDGLEQAVAKIADTLEAQVDMENESDELLGRLLGRLAGRIEQLETR